METIKVKDGDRVVIDGEELVFTSSSVGAYTALVWSGLEGQVSLIRRSDHRPQLVPIAKLRRAVEEQLGEGKE